MASLVKAHLSLDLNIFLALCLALLLTAPAPSRAQVRPERRPAPQVNSAAGKTPAAGLSEKELTRQWRQAVDVRHPLKEGLAPSRQSSVASVMIDEGFEDAPFPPTGWSSVAVSGAPAWAVASGSQHTGVNAAYSEFGSSSPPNQIYLITKRLTLNSLLLYRITFWLKRDFVDAFDPDTFYVKMSTVDSLPAHFTTTLLKCSTGPDTSTDPTIYTTTYKQFTVTVSGVGGTTWFAFDHENMDGQSLELDDVKVEEIVNNDIVALSVDDPQPAARKDLGVSFQPKATYRNNGVLTQTNIPVRFKIINALGAVVYNNVQTIASLAPNVSAQVTFAAFAPSAPGDHTARALAQNPGDTNPTNDSIAVQFRIPDNVSGVKTVGLGGDLATLIDAVHYLNDNNVAGPLTFSLISSSYAESPLAIDQIHYTTTQQPVLIKPAAGISPTITISALPGSPYGVRIKGTGNLTFDGSNNGTTSRNLTLSVDTAAYFAPAILLTDGCRNVTVTNMAIKGYRRSGAVSNSAIVLDTLTAAKKDSNIVFNNLLITGAFNAFFLVGPAVGSTKVAITNCAFGGAGLDGIAQAAIATFNIDSLLVAGNDIQNIVCTDALLDLFGVYLGPGSTNAIVRANRIHAMRNHVNGYYAHGFVDAAGTGSNLLCYNNFLYDILAQGAGTDPNFSVGLYSADPENTGERYIYNSIYLSGHDSSTAPTSLSAGIAFGNGVTSLQLRNNIVYSAMSFSGAFVGNRSYGIFAGTSAWPPGSTSARNDLYAPGAQGAVGFLNGTNRTLLTDWQTATSQDAGSISADPVFAGPGDLHIQAVGVGSPVNDLATPFAGITTDIDNDVRNASTPDIGADEFSPQLGASATMLQGWNIASVPLVPPDPRKTVLFPTATSSAFAFEGNYVVKDTLVSGPGYWLKFASAQTVQIVGTPIVRDTFDVANGWNLIGSISQPVLVSTITSIPSGVITSQFFGYSNGYTGVDSIKPMHGYWVKVTQTAKLILAAPGALVPGEETIRIVPTSEMPPPAPGESPHAGAGLPKYFALGQNYPNPFNPSTVIDYRLPVRSHVALRIYNMLGQVVATLVDDVQEAGFFQTVWTADVANGIYFYRVTATPLNGEEPSFTDVKKMILMK